MTVPDSSREAVTPTMAYREIPLERTPATQLAILTEGEEFAQIGSWSVALPEWEWEASPGAYRILGHSPDSGLDPGQALMGAIVPEDAEWVQAAMAEDLAHPRAFERSFRIMRSDGMLREVRITGRVATDDAGAPVRVSGMMQDVTEAEVLRKAWQTIKRGNDVLVRAEDEDHLITDMCHALVENGGYRLAWYARYDSSAQPPLMCVARAGFDEGYVDGCVLDRPREIIDMDPSTLAIVRGEQFIVSDMAVDDRFAPWREFALQRGYRSLTVLPVRVKGAIDGAWLVYSAFAGAFDGGGHPLLASLADDIGYGIGRLRDAAMIGRTLLATVDMLSAVLETRDPYTGGHQRRVAELVGAIGAELGLDEDRVKGMQLGAAIHDLGKIAVPAEILSKPGRILPQEMDLIRTHVTRGYEIVHEYDWPWPIPEMVRDHHEHLDGSGYPNGLRGDEIVLEARVISVADTFEAMSHHRPYRPSLGDQEALRELTEGRGVRYDADVVDALLRVLERGFEFQPNGWVTSAMGMPLKQATS